MAIPGCAPQSAKYVKGHCYKLSIYGEDADFLEHRDAQKLDGMFATLIIQLPCKYEVVDDKPIFSVKHIDYVYEHFFGSSKDCRYNIYYAAHYCGLAHKINKIKHGIYLSVTYNICWEGPRNIMPSRYVSNIERVTAAIDNVFKFWDRNEKCAIGIKLEHLYSNNELSAKGINALKAADFAKVHSLMQSKVAQSMVCTLCSCF